MSCPICNLRKEKRFCLAMHDRICAQCCGEQREVSLECPSECPYLQQARQHERPERSAEPPPEVFAEIELRQDFVTQHEPLMAGVLQMLTKAARADRFLHDRQVVGALANMASSYQTLITSGLVYQEATTNPAQQTVIAALEQLFDEFRQVEQENRGYTSLKDRDIFQALVFTLRLAHLHSSGRPLSRGFIDFLQERFAATDEGLEAAPEGASRIILP